MIYHKTTTKQTKKKLRNNGRTLRMHTKKQPKKYWGTKRKGKNHGSAKSRELVEERKRLKNNIEQTKSDRIKQNYMAKYRSEEEHKARHDIEHNELRDASPM